MKKKFFGLFAVATMLLASSCTENEIISQSTGNEVKVTFTTELRNDVKSRTVGDDTDNIDQLIFAVYDEMGNELPELRQSTHMTDDDAKKTITLTSEENKKKATIEVVLVKGQTYSFAFWAQKKDFSAYTFDPETADVTVNYANRTANQREADAFFKGITNHKVTGTFTMDVTLKRPFAQVNFLTSQDDIINARKAGFNPSQSAIIIKNVAKKLNVLTGGVSELENNEVTFGLANLLFDDQNLIESTNINGVTGEWKYLATAYFLPQQKSEETKINATMEIKAVDANKAITKIVATDITAQRNYRTNIYGNLLTSNGTFNVVIDPDFEDDDHNVQSGVYDAASSSLSDLLATNKEMEGDLVYNVSGLSTTDNFTVEIPAETKASSLTLNFTDTKDGANMTIQDATSGAYAGTVVIKNPADKTVSELTVGLPAAHVYLAQGNYTKVTASTSSSTLVIGGGATVGTLTVDKGNVRVEEGGDIETIERGEDNSDPVTYVVFESEEDIPTVENEDSEISYVSSTEFDLTAAIAEGGEVKLTMDVELKESLVIAKGIETIIDLNGFTISQEKECTASYSMIDNKGTLIIKDTKGNGKISFNDTGDGDPSFGWGSYTIRNEGTLVVENGIIEHLGQQEFAKHMICAIFQYSGSTTINDGTISTPKYRSIRLWKGDMTINGGTFDGQLWVQAVDNTAELTINGGTFEPNGKDGSSVFVENKTYDVAFAVTGGTFQTKIGCSDASKLAGCIIGGTFTEEAKNNTSSILFRTIISTAEDLVALGGTKINGIYELAANIDMSGKEMKSMEVSGGASVEFIGNGHTISNLELTAAGIHGMTGAGNEVAGLFDLSAPATTVSLTVNDLKIENATVSCSGYAAAIVGYNPNGGTVITLNNVDVERAEVTAESVAALVGYTTGPVNLTNCDVTGNISLIGEAGRPEKVGALVGTANTASCAVITTNCTNTTTYGDYGRVINGATWNGSVIASASTSADLETALSSIKPGDKVAITLNPGHYIIPDAAQGKTLTFIGTGNPEDVTIAAQDDGAAEGDCDYSFDGSTVTFEGVTITTSTTYFPGYVRMKGIYKNCIINGVYTLYDNSIFENCTFNVKGDLYNIWTWGASIATFTDCTFNTSGKAILLYGGANTKLTVNKCIFNDANDNEEVNNKAAIEVGSDWSTDTKEIVATSCTVNGFDVTDKGTSTGSTLWGNKNSLSTERLSVTIDGVKVY